MQLSIAIPTSLVLDIPHLREKTSHLGMIGRALAIFRVDEIIIYNDRPYRNQHRDADLISTILNYMETPQYLRKYLFPKTSKLNYAGVLPPLRTPHHPITKKIADLRNGDWREGVVIRVGAETLVDIGVERPISLNDRSLSLWQRITVRIHKDKTKVKIRRVKPQHVNGMYWGYTVNVSNLSLGRILRSRTFNLVILTSKYGEPLTEAIEKLRSKLKESKNTLIAFGSPKYGLMKILEREGYKIENFDTLILNTIPGQGVETIRTEEAIYATLAVLNILK